MSMYSILDPNPIWDHPMFRAEQDRLRFEALREAGCMCTTPNVVSSLFQSKCTICKVETPRAES